jgi:hypothetical protein
MDYSRHRRTAGLVLGIVLGFGYSLSANLVNRLVLPDIPLYVPPPGPIGLFFLTPLMLGLLGLIAAWGDEGLPSVLISGLAGSFLSSVWIMLFETADRGSTFALLVLLFLPRMFFYLPFGGLIRWLIARIDRPSPTPVAPVRRLLPVVLSFVLMLFLGSFEMYPKETRASLVRMNELILTGMQAQATNRSELPKPLQPVNGFIQRANGNYRFTIGADPDVLPVQRPIVEYGKPEPLIIVRFENGFRFGCVFSPPYVNPACIDF